MSMSNWKQRLLKLVLKSIHLGSIGIYSGILRTVYASRGRPVYLCLVKGEGKDVSFETEITSGIVKTNKIIDDIGIIIRKFVGESVLVSHGVPLEPEHVPKVILIADPITLIPLLGIVKYHKLISSWTGISTVTIGDIKAVVIEYSVLK